MTYQVTPALCKGSHLLAWASLLVVSRAVWEVLLAALPAIGYAASRLFLMETAVLVRSALSSGNAQQPIEAACQ